MDGALDESASSRRKHFRGNVLQSLAETWEVLTAETTTDAKREGHCNPFEIPDEPIEQNEMLKEEIIREWNSRPHSMREEEPCTDPSRSSLPSYETEERLPFQRVLVDGEEASGVSLKFNSLHEKSGLRRLPLPFACTSITCL